MPEYVSTVHLSKDSSAKDIQKRDYQHRLAKSLFS